MLVSSWGQPEGRPFNNMPLQRWICIFVALQNRILIMCVAPSVWLRQYDNLGEDFGNRFFFPNPFLRALVVSELVLNINEGSFPLYFCKQVYEVWLWGNLPQHCTLSMTGMSSEHVCKYPASKCIYLKVAPVDFSVIAKVFFPWGNSPELRSSTFPFFHSSSISFKFINEI